MALLQQQLSNIDQPSQVIWLLELSGAERGRTTKILTVAEVGGWGGTTDHMITHLMKWDERHNPAFCQINRQNSVRQTNHLLIGGNQTPTRPAFNFHLYHCGLLGEAGRSPWSWSSQWILQIEPTTPTDRIFIFSTNLPLAEIYARIPTVFFVETGERRGCRCSCNNIASQTADIVGTLMPCRVIRRRMWAILGGLSY